MNFIIRRRKLGRTSCKGIRLKMHQPMGKTIGVYQPIPPNADIVFRWGATNNINARLVVNSARAIHVTMDKTEFRKVLNEKKLCPKTWFKLEDIEYPAIIRPRHHAQGRRLFLCNNEMEARAAIVTCGEGWYASAFINKTAEYRVFVAQGRAVWVTRKTPGNPNNIAWNVARGGRFDNVNWDAWPLKVVKYAIEAMNLCSLDFGGVDVMVDAEDNAYVLEINAAPSQTSEYRQGCVAKVFDYIIAHNNVDRIPLVEAKGGYLKFIHPAISQDARLPNA